MSRSHDPAGALAALEPLVGQWSAQVEVPGVPAGRAVFEWALDETYLAHRAEFPQPEYPDSLVVIAAAEAGGYTFHYFDSRGVVRLYAMELRDRRWTLLRDRADFSPLSFCQRFEAELSADGTTIDGRWEKSEDGRHWDLDFAITYTRIPTA